MCSQRGFFWSLYHTSIVIDPPCRWYPLLMTCTCYPTPMKYALSFITHTQKTIYIINYLIMWCSLLGLGCLVFIVRWFSTPSFPWLCSVIFISIVPSFYVQACKHPFFSKLKKKIHYIWAPNPPNRRGCPMTPIGSGQSLIFAPVWGVKAGGRGAFSRGTAYTAEN
jgi:hypothetical protein